MNKLDEAEANAIKMIEFFQGECRRQCEPYVKVLISIHDLRPRTFIVDGQLMIPIDPPATAEGAKP